MNGTVSDLRHHAAAGINQQVRNSALSANLLRGDSVISPEHVLEILAAMVGTDAFRARLPNAHLLNEPAEIEEAREDLPASLLPFMRVEEPQWPDIYALDLDDHHRNRIVVWSDHAIVAGWNTMDDFLSWLRELPPRASSEL